MAAVRVLQGKNKKGLGNSPKPLLSLEPANRFELLTCALRVRCSTPEPRRLSFCEEKSSIFPSQRVIVSGPRYFDKATFICRKTPPQTKFFSDVHLGCTQYASLQISRISSASSAFRVPKGASTEMFSAKRSISDSPMFNSRSVVGAPMDR